MIYATGAKCQTPDVGDTFPDFSFYNILANEKLITLQNLRGNYVLVLFWASWNPESRRINRELLSVYSRYKEKIFLYAKRFHIVSVSIDTNPKPYELALKKDNPAWFYHYCDFNGWKSQPVVKCNIKQIPTIFLLDANGIVVKKNFSVKELEIFLKNM